MVLTSFKQNIETINRNVAQFKTQTICIMIIITSAFLLKEFNTVRDRLSYGRNLNSCQK